MHAAHLSDWRDQQWYLGDLGVMTCGCLTISNGFVRLQTEQTSMKHKHRSRCRYCSNSTCVIACCLKCIRTSSLTSPQEYDAEIVPHVRDLSCSEVIRFKFQLKCGFMRQLQHSLNDVSHISRHLCHFVSCPAGNMARTMC